MLCCRARAPLRGGFALGAKTVCAVLQARIQMRGGFALGLKLCAVLQGKGTVVQLGHSYEAGLKLCVVCCKAGAQLCTVERCLCTGAKTVCAVFRGKSTNVQGHS